MIVLHSDWEVLLWFGIDMKWIKLITVPCIQDGIQCPWRKQARKLFIRRMRTGELLRSYPRRVRLVFQMHQGLGYSEYRHGWKGRGGLLPCLHTANAMWQYCRTAGSSLSWKEKHVSGFQKPSHPGFLNWVTYPHQKLWGKLFKTWERRKIFC